jgi:fermentation-respiration switch protein FrsA (DUF1100 family)
MHLPGFTHNRVVALKAVEPVRDARRRRRIFWLIVVVLAIVPLSLGAGALVWRARAEAHKLVTNPIQTRHLPGRRPIDFGMVYDELTATTADGQKLAGWYVPTKNGALVIAQHGYKADRGEMLNEAALLHRHGFGVLITSLRAHDLSSGELMTFGRGEMLDLQAWYQMAIAQEGVDANRIGILGNSLGGTLAIEFAAVTPGVKAVAANSAFSSLTDTLETSLRFFTGLPSFPFAPLITFFAEREANIRVADVDATRWIGRLSPRPVLLMQGGSDVVISRQSGQRLFDAAGEPRELWYEPKIAHGGFDNALPDEYERRVVEFFTRYLVER